MQRSQWNLPLKNASKLFLGLLLLAGLIWYLNRPSQEQLQRQEACKSWGVKDEKQLAKCRESYTAEEAVIAPIRKPYIEEAIARFNKAVSSLASSHTRASGEYAEKSAGDLAKIAGGLIQIVTPEEAKTSSANGQRVRVAGTITADPEVGSGEAQQYFEIQGETHEVNALPPTVYLDIESLGREERQFIRDHCFSFTATPCRAIVVGHIGEMVTMRSRLFSKLGLIADEIDISPLTWDTADTNGLLPDEIGR